MSNSDPARVVVAPSGKRLLNVGAGTNYSREWTNIDLARGPDVLFHDLRDPLPFADGTFHAVYTSHVLEHLERRDGARLLSEIYRVLAKRGIVRVVVPDLERIARDYLERLDAAGTGDEAALRRLRWIKLELLDQLVRERPGGEMLRALQEGTVDREDALERLGDELADVGSPASVGVAARLRGLGPRGVARIVAERVFPARRSPRRTGEVHRWMYDRVELAQCLHVARFEDVRVVAHDESLIPSWARYALDTSVRGGPRKPDSLFMEATAGSADGAP